MAHDCAERPTGRALQRPQTRCRPGQGYGSQQTAQLRLPLLTTDACDRKNRWTQIQRRLRAEMPLPTADAVPVNARAENQRGSTRARHPRQRLAGTSEPSRAQACRFFAWVREMMARRKLSGGRDGAALVFRRRHLLPGAAWFGANVAALGTLATGCF
jgi:hypothetical protein